jgi:acyl-CoA reductase-like NAD-dependent aldehyde dehydrogenase
LTGSCIHSHDEAVNTSTRSLISPVDGSALGERPLVLPAQADAVLDKLTRGFSRWSRLARDERARRLEAMVSAIVSRREELALELTMQMGRPIAHAPSEIDGFAERARTMIRLGLEVLEDHALDDKPGFERRIERVPLGVVLLLSPWNYPYLTAVNVLVPALLAGNVVLLKHSEQTPLVADRLVEAARQAGIPEEVFSSLDASNEEVARWVADRRVDFVAFTGSVEGGRAVSRAAAGRFVGTSFELGGNDAAYVFDDADLERAAESIVEGALFNAGQSCCAIERAYVHEAVYDRFVEAAVAAAKRWRLGDPRDASSTLGPVVRTRNAERIRRSVDAAVAAGARALLDPEGFPAHERGLPYLPPALLIDVHDAMDVMAEETFGPVLPIARVSSDEEAIARIERSRYGLTAALFGRDVERARAIAGELDVGTVYMNRCDVLDPELPWVGVKDSGRGVTLSRYGYDALTRPKSLHFKLPSR